MSGKKAINLLTDLKIPHDYMLAGQFSETRNKLFEHNHNPKKNHIPDLILEPDYWSVMATSSYLPVNIHTSIEQEYVAYIDYYQDYYDLEKLLIDAIKRFRNI